VRETRRSTQGVTLEEVKSAEQLAKKKQAEAVSHLSPRTLVAFTSFPLLFAFNFLSNSLNEKLKKKLIIKFIKN
jgi:hypothetical protein